MSVSGKKVYSFFKEKPYYILITAIVVGIVGFRAMHPIPMCPDDYGTDNAGSAEYIAATDKWTNDFFDSHPDASLKDWGEARHQFWIDNHCTAALESYEQAKAGNVDPKKMEKIEGVIRDAINNPTP